MGGSAVTKIGNTGRGTDGTGWGWGTETRGSIWGLWNFMFLRDSQAEIQSGHLVLAVGGP